MEFMVVIVTILSIIIMFLLKRLRYFHSLLTNRDPCLCQKWLDMSRTRVSPEVLRGQNYQITEAFRHLQITAGRFNYHRPLSVVSAEKILLHATRLVDEDVINNLIGSAIEREHIFVANSLNEAWRLLSPKISPGRTFVKLFCQNLKLLKLSRNKNVIALDTEMVGAGPKGHINMVARVSLVDKYHWIYDKFVKPTRPVTDYRTFVTGITNINLMNAPDFKTVQKEVADLIRKRILVGHDLEKDLAILNLEHPKEDIRDTALYPPFRKVLLEKPSLKYLSKKFLDRDIQTGVHNSIEDASAAMDLYLTVSGQWEETFIYSKLRETIISPTPPNDKF